MVASVVAGDAAEAFEAPGGWSVVTDDAIPGTLRQAVYLKVAGTDEPSDYTWTLATPRMLAGGITTYSGVDPAHPVDAQAAAAQLAGGGVVAAPPITTSVDNTLLVQLTAATASSGEGTLTPSPGLEERWEAASVDPDATTDVVVSASDRPQPIAGAVDSLAVTASGPGPAIGAVLALRPAGTTVPPTDPVLVGAGDIAACDSPGDEATAALLDQIPGTVFTAGDNAYVNGTAGEFARCYSPTWGRFKARTMPAPGNHEYQQDPAARGYYGYFGAAAGDPAKGYYDYTLGSWHVVVLNTSCVPAGGCQAGSPQEQWLRQVLAASDARCTVAITHRARFSSGLAHGSNANLQAFWQALYDHGADLVVSGHDHVYERFGAQRPDGVPDPLFGLRQIVVGTGGRDHRKFGPPAPSSEVREASTFGVLKLTLHADSYDWQFVPEAGKTFSDSGTTACHGAPPLALPVTGPAPS
jgi:hypothetical protein